MKYNINGLVTDCFFFLFFAVYMVLLGVRGGELHQLNKEKLVFYSFRCCIWVAGHLSTKSDVYSFGVVLLEMLTGKRSMDKTRPNGEHHLAEWARPYLSDRRKILRIIDPRLEGHYSVKGAQKAGQLAFRCLSRDSKVRPSMADVVEILEQIQNLKDMANATYPSQGIGGDGTRMGSSVHRHGTKHGSVLSPRQATPSRG